MRATKAVGCTRLGLLSWVSLVAFSIFSDVVPAAPQPVGTVLVFVHGINSDASTWNDVVGTRDCPTVRLGVPAATPGTCYRVQFADRAVPGIVWTNGDGSTLRALRDELRYTVRTIRRQVAPARIIFVAHSRGALVVRAYIQSLVTPPPFRIGLVTLGAPHQGTPLARIGVWLRDRGNRPDEVVEELRFAFSPGVITLATEHAADGQPVRSAISRRVYGLNDSISRLTELTPSIGELTSEALRMGENVEGDFDALNDVGAQALAFLTPGSFDQLLAFVLNNIAQLRERPVLIDTWSCSGTRRTEFPWACDGDGVVPTISQRIDQVPGYVGENTTLHRIALTGVRHADETGRVSEINTLIGNVNADLRAR